MKWFGECATLDQVKTLYKQLAKQYHPDVGGDTATMQEVNREFAYISAHFIKGANLSEEETEKEILSSEAYRKAIGAIAHLGGITIELVGWWIWVTGDTYAHRKALREAGLMFAPKKLAWYFRTAEYKVSKGGKKSLDEIRAKYGSEVLHGSKPKNSYIH
ncbi:J domain-containing protein [Nubsella zeaxanthinifaciens]|uniref:J domain-containing protein n=1 Tax=Nubsella zeaxanthinifaciens TaxID=392412 RepID=UPI000DE2DD73|nr:J domain-containing protein [Nubsella zeaxanthinifaciens]